MALAFPSGSVVLAREAEPDTPSRAIARFHASPGHTVHLPGYIQHRALLLPRHKGRGCELTRTQAACTCARPSEVWALWCPYHAQSWTDLAGSHTRADPAAPLALQLRSRVISESLAHHDSWIMD